MPEQNIFPPDSKLSRSAYVSTFQQYEELYKESIENPEKFWGDIAKQFHWETPADEKNFMQYNFDISKGPISIKWMEGASTNICYNLLDRNIKNGHGDKIAFYWYVCLLRLSSKKKKEKWNETKKKRKTFLLKKEKVLTRGWKERKKLSLLLIFPFFFTFFYPRVSESLSHLRVWIISCAIIIIWFFHLSFSLVIRQKKNSERTTRD